MEEEKDKIVEEHTQKMTVHFIEYFPNHEPRETDPHYHIFNQTRARLKRLGLLKCWRCGNEESIQLHHSLAEQSLINGVDIEKFSELYPEFGITDDESFQIFVEGEGNLTPLCARCHIGEEAIHLLPYPLWLAGRFWRKDLPHPGLVTKG